MHRNVRSPHGRKGLVAAVFTVVLVLLTGVAWAEAPDGARFVGDGRFQAGISGSVEILSDHDGESISDVSNPLEDRAAALSATGQPGSFLINVGGTVRQADAYRMLSMVNAERARLGRAPLQWDANLEQAALQRSAEISISFGHSRPDDSSCFTAFPDDLLSVGENILFSTQGTAERAYHLWSESSGHYENMVSAKFTKIGIACFQGEGRKTYWVQCFGSGGESDASATRYSGPALFAVPIPDSLITATSTSVSMLTPGVNSLRVLPTIHVSFSGVVGSTQLSGTVDYPYQLFTWASANPRIASIDSTMGSLYCRGVSPGRTTVRAMFPTSSRLIASVPVQVTGDGAFSDVNAGTPHRKDILFLSSTGVTAGYADGSFKPYADVARADMAAFLCRYAASLGMDEAATWQPTAADWVRFSDVNAATPHAREILWLAHTGITTGFPDGTFRPYASIARCDMAAFLRRFCRVAGIDAASSWVPAAGDRASFPDVVVSTPHRDDILWLAHVGITKGFPEGTFRPYGNVARCDMAAFLGRVGDLTTA